MQIKVLDRNFYKSASYLRCPQELNAQIYEAIHGLASLLECVDDLDLSDKCKNKIKKYKDYPQCKLWKGYEKELFCYIAIHLDVWIYDCKYNSNISLTNFKLLRKLFCYELYLTPDICQKYLSNIQWITDEFIQMHRSVLIQKEIERENKLLQELNQYKWEYRDKSDKFRYKVEKQIENNFYYRKLWPDCPTDLKMKYDWRK